MKIAYYFHIVLGYVSLFLAINAKHINLELLLTAIFMVLIAIAVKE